MLIDKSRASCGDDDVVLMAADEQGFVKICCPIRALVAKMRNAVEDQTSMRTSK